MIEGRDAEPNPYLGDLSRETIGYWPGPGLLFFLVSPASEDLLSRPRLTLGPPANLILSLLWSSYDPGPGVLLMLISNSAFFYPIEIAGPVPPICLSEGMGYLPGPGTILLALFTVAERIPDPNL